MSSRSPDSKRTRRTHTPPRSGAATDIAVFRPCCRLVPPVFQASLPRCPPGRDMWTRSDIQVNDVLAQTYFDGTVVLGDNDDERHRFRDTTNPLQGRHLYNVVRDNRFTRTLEVGLAMGASACWITQAHRDLDIGGRHVAIDPNQTTQYENIGRRLVQKCGNADFLEEVLEQPSYSALPQLVDRVRAGTMPRFDLIYIDGWHTFDYTLVDCFFADLLLNVHGVLVLDDIKHPAVGKCFDFLVRNYRHFQLVSKTPACDRDDPRGVGMSQATFVKVAEDTRRWNHFNHF